jgi:hypothetical protein
VLWGWVEGRDILVCSVWGRRVGGGGKGENGVGMCGVGWSEGREGRGRAGRGGVWKGGVVGVLVMLIAINGLYGGSSPYNPVSLPSETSQDSDSIHNIV